MNLLTEMRIDWKFREIYRQFTKSGRRIALAFMFNAMRLLETQAAKPEGITKNHGEIHELSDEIYSKFFEGKRTVDDLALFCGFFIDILERNLEANPEIILDTEKVKP